MEQIKYNHLSLNQRDKLQSLVEKQDIYKITEGTTDKGWAVKSIKVILKYQQLIYLANKIGCSYKTIQRELLRGVYLFSDFDFKKYIWIKTAKYIAYQGQQRYEMLQKKRNYEKAKIIKHPELKDKIDELRSLGNKTGDAKLNQSLKTIAGRMKSENYEFSVSATTLYNYVHNKTVLNTKYLIFPAKKQKGKWKYGKRQNGTSIDQRPYEVNKRLVFGHWEIDLIESANHKCYLFTAYERKSRYGIAFKIPDKKASTIIRLIKWLQLTKIWIFGVNVKSITTDNGSEFWGWNEFAHDLTRRFKIPVYFCHSYASWEKGGVENFNRMIRRILMKKIDFTNINQKEISALVDSINNKFREILNFKTASEVYNTYISNSI